MKPNKAMCYAGYISPKGALFSCPREGHRGLAFEIVMNYLKVKTRNPEKYLDDKKWVKLLSDGRVEMHSLDRVTQRQLDTLADLLDCPFADEDFIIKGFRSGDRYMHGSAGSWKKNIQMAILILAEALN